MQLALPKDNQCRFILTDNEDNNLGWCSCNIERGSYCSKHYILTHAVVPVSMQICRPVFEYRKGPRSRTVFDRGCSGKEKEEYMGLF